MAINVAIRPQETGLDKLVKGLSAANDVLSLTANAKKVFGGPSDLEKAQLQELQDKASGIVLPGSIDIEKVKQVDQNTPGAMARRVRLKSGDNGVETQYFVPQPKAKAELSPLEQALLQARIDDLNAKKEKDKNKDLSPGQKAADVSFGKEYQDWNAQGGYANVDKQLGALEGVKEALKNNPNLTGPRIGATPEWIRSVSNPESIAVQQAANQAVQATLRQTLGAQFTEKEGVRVMNNSYDPRLSPEENIKKIDATIKQLKSMAIEKENASQYFENNSGSLNGYRPVNRQPQAAAVIPKPSNNPQAARIQELLAEKQRRAGKQ